MTKEATDCQMQRETGKGGKMEEEEKSGGRRKNGGGEAQTRGAADPIYMGREGWGDMATGQTRELIFPSKRAHFFVWHVGERGAAV